MIQLKKLALALEGGGILGIAYLKVLAGLAGINAGGLESIRLFAGTSAGAHFAVALWLGADIEFLTKMIVETEWKKFTGRFPNLFLLYWRKALYSREFAETWTKQYIYELGFVPEVTFEEASRLRHGKDCCVVALSLTTEEPVVFSAKTTPNVPVWKAVLASQCIPGVWAPVEINGEMFYDGGLLWNHPVDLLLEAGYKPEECLGIRLDPEKSPKKFRSFPKTFTGIAIRIFKILMTHANKSHVPKKLWPDHIIVVKTPSGIGATDFDLNEIDKKRLLRRGSDAWLDFYFNWTLKNGRDRSDDI